MSKIAALAKGIGHVLDKNSPLILTGLAIAGVVSTTVLAVRGTPGAVKAIELEQTNRNIDRMRDADPNEEGDYGTPTQLTVFEKCKIAAPYYVPAFITGGLTIFCIISAQGINQRRQAALIGAYTIAEGAHREYRDQVIETLGKNKDRDVRDALAQKHVDEDPPSDEMIDGLEALPHMSLCKDEMSGRYFYSTMEDIKGAVNDVNAMINHHEYASLNDFYAFLELEPTRVGEMLGWSNDDRKMSLSFSSTITKQQKPCIVVHYDSFPKQGYFRVG